MDLDQLINTERLKLKSDGYQISIGELANLYVSQELTIDPDFQREFRWTNVQKVNFVESILLQFPLPSIFVTTRPNGTWEVLDGLQRLSTVFQFMGILKDAAGMTVEPLVLTATERFADLAGMHFSQEIGDPALPPEFQIDFKRTRVDVKIILRESDDEMLYELFTRLNAGGTQLTSQDIRNALINKREQAFRVYLDELVANEDFLKALSLSDSDINQRYHYELLLIFLIVINESDEAIGSITNLDETLTSLVMKSSRLYDWDRDFSKSRFVRVFRTLVNTLESNAFEPRPPIGAQPSGFSREAFIAICSVADAAIERKQTPLLRTAVEEFWALEHPPTNFEHLVRWGRDYFAKSES